MLAVYVYCVDLAAYRQCILPKVSEMDQRVRAATIVGLQVFGAMAYPQQ
jgi:hypothetical protein